MSELTTNPADPRLGHGADDHPVPQQAVYLVLSEEERAKGFVQPYRDRYIHKTCGTETVMGQALSETYARNPKFYGATYCVHCQMHRPVSEFTWSVDGRTVGSDDPVPAPDFFGNDKALNFTALSRVGVNFNRWAMFWIKLWLRLGWKVRAQQIVLQQLKKELGE